MGTNDPLEPTPHEVTSTEEAPTPGMQIVRLYPAQFGTARFIEFDSVINIRPRQGNRTRSVEDAAVRAAVTSIVARVVVR